MGKGRIYMKNRKLKRMLAAGMALCLTFTIAGCGNQLKKGSAVHLEDSALEGLTMSFAEDSGLLTPDGATVLVENASGSDLSYSQGYAVQVLQNGTWYELKQKDSGSVVTGELLWLPDGSTDTYEFGWKDLYGTLPDGTYRIAKNYADFTAAYWVTAEFTVENGTAMPVSDQQ